MQLLFFFSFCLAASRPPCLETLHAFRFRALVADVLDNPRDPANIAKVREKVNALTREFPVYR